MRPLFGSDVAGSMRSEVNPLQPFAVPSAVHGPDKTVVAGELGVASREVDVGTLAKNG